MGESQQSPASEAVDRLLPPAKELALEHALTGCGISEIARRVGVHRNTVAGWMKDPVWMQELAERQVERRTQAARLLDAEIEPSIRVLIEVRDDEDVHPAVRLKAANDILDRALGKPIGPAAEPEMSDEELERWVAEQMGAEDEAERETEDA
jgi:transposase-like protein